MLLGWCLNLVLHMLLMMGIFIYRFIQNKFKRMLLHNSNQISCILVAHAIRMKKTYEHMLLILKTIKYDEHLWWICGNLKIVGLLLGLYNGCTKYHCFLCLWDSRATNQHYLIKEWSKRDNFTLGQQNVKNCWFSQSYFTTFTFKTATYEEFYESIR